jgi:glucose-6-phosphate-specific signal transduction histidine kinase
MQSQAQDLENRARRVCELAGELVALSEQGRPDGELRSVHDELSDQLEALNAQSSIMAAAIGA